MLDALRRAARSLDLEGRAVAVAVSGGVDSTALAHGLAALAEPLRLRLSVAHVDHGLRGAASEADAAAVRAMAEALGLPFAADRVDPEAVRVAAPSSRSRPTLEEAARRVRYEALGRLAAQLGADRIATAHTADDQAETVLLRLLRGAGPAGLGGIPPRARGGLVVRPLLEVSRAEVLAFARERGLAWREDGSNADRRHARARLRHDWMPGLRAAFNPQLLRAIGRLAEAQREESVWLDSWTEREAARRFRPDPDEAGVLWIEAKGWDVGTTPDALGRRLVRLALHRCGGGRDVSRAHLDRSLAFLRSPGPGRRLELPAGLRLERTARGFRLGRLSLPSSSAC